MKRMLIVLLLVLGVNSLIMAQSKALNYDGYIKELKSGNYQIDYTAFRDSYLEKHSIFNAKYDSFKTKAEEALDKNDYNTAIKWCESMLNEDYTSIPAHYMLKLTYKQLGDSANYNKERAIELGLFNSIISSGDGKTCETGWHVTKIEDEYFVLRILGDFTGQALVEGKHWMCDRMTTKTDSGGTKDYFFEIKKVMEAEAKLFEK